MDFKGVDLKSPPPPPKKKTRLSWKVTVLSHGHDITLSLLRHIKLSRHRQFEYPFWPTRLVLTSFPARQSKCANTPRVESCHLECVDTWLLAWSRVMSFRMCRHWLLAWSPVMSFKLCRQSTKPAIQPCHLKLSTFLAVLSCQLRLVHLTRQSDKVGWLGLRSKCN